MMVKQELVKRVKDYFDLNIYETKVWLALLSKGISSAGEIAELSGVPRSRTYDVLESLEKVGFAIEKLGKPVRYIAVKPEIVIEKLKTNVKIKADEKVKTLAGLKETKEYAELEDLHKTGILPVKNSEISGAVRGRLNLYSHIKEMLENAEKEAIICLPAAEIEAKTKFFTGVFDKLKKNKVAFKVAVNGDDAEIKRLENKFKIKFNKININARFVITDRQQLVSVISQMNEEEDLGIWLNSEFFAASLAYLFDNSLN